MSKAAQIRSLLDADLTDGEIAEQADCSEPYVRAVRGRLLRPEISKAWERANAQRLGCWPTTIRYRENAEYRRGQKARNQARRERQKQLQPA